MILVRDVGLPEVPSCEEFLALQIAGRASLGCPELPVFFRGECVGFARGGRFRQATREERRWCGFTNVADLRSEMRAGKQTRGRWWTSSFSAGSFTWRDFWPKLAFPNAGDYTGSALIARQLDDSNSAAIPHGRNVSTDTKHLVHSLLHNTGAVNGGLDGCYVPYDRVLTYEACGFTANTVQNMTNTLTAQRWAGAGDGGLQMCCTQQTSVGATAANMNAMVYTDQDGNTGANVPTGATLTIAVSSTFASEDLGGVLCPWDNTLSTHVAPFMPLADGDSGARKIESIKTSAANSGTMCFVLMKPMGLFPLFNAVAFHQSTIGHILNLARVIDGACLSILSWSGLGGSATWGGDLGFAWG